jgi:hypothetical protein
MQKYVLVASYMKRQVKMFVITNKIFGHILKFPTLNSLYVIYKNSVHTFRKHVMSPP